MPGTTNTKNKMGDRELLLDAMMVEAHMCAAYLRADDRCTTPNLKDEFLRLMQDDENVLSELFIELQKRGWQTVATADNAQITTALQRHQAAAGTP